MQAIHIAWSTAITCHTPLLDVISPIIANYALEPVHQLLPHFYVTLNLPIHLDMICTSLNNLKLAYETIKNKMDIMIFLNNTTMMSPLIGFICRITGMNLCESTTWIRQHYPISGPIALWYDSNIREVMTYDYIEDYDNFIKLDPILLGYISWGHQVPKDDNYKYAYKTFDMNNVYSVSMNPTTIYTQHKNGTIYLRWDSLYSGLISNDLRYIPFESKEAALKWVLSTGNWIKEQI
jgi:hypothetical protein